MIEILGAEFPLVQAPMAGVTTPALAAAVSNAGALGSLGIATLTAAEARATIRATKSLTEKPINVNVFCHQPAAPDAVRDAEWIAYLSPVFGEFGIKPPAELREIYQSFITNEAMFRMLLEERPSIVSFHFGLPPQEWIAAFRAAGIRTLASATCLDEAYKIAGAGIDGVVAQGIEAGGHRGFFDPEGPDERLSTSVLTRLLVLRAGLPVIAAGGIMDGAGIRAALDLGAVAAQLGTAFVLCPESAANTAYREALHGAAAGETRLTPVLSGRPARGIVNRFIRHCEAEGAPRPAAYPYAYDLAKQLNAAALKQGSSEYAAYWAGQGVPLARAMPAAELVRTLVAEWQSPA